MPADDLVLMISDMDQSDGRILRFCLRQSANWWKERAELNHGSCSLRVKWNLEWSARPKWHRLGEPATVETHLAGCDCRASLIRVDRFIGSGKQSFEDKRHAKACGSPETRRSERAAKLPSSRPIRRERSPRRGACGHAATTGGSRRQRDGRRRDSLHGRRRQHQKTQETSTRNQLPLNKKEGEKKTSAESHSHSHSVCRRRRRAPGRGINLNNSIREEHSGSAATRQSCQSLARIPRKERRRAPDYLLSAHIDPTSSM